MLELSQLDNVSDEVKHCPLYAWAKLFKATTWEEIRMITENNDTMKQVEVTLRKLSEDEKIKLQCEARERYKSIEIALHQRGLKEGEDIGIVKGEQIGICKEQDHGCKVLVKSLKSINTPDDIILQQLIDGYSLSREDALKYIQ